jgi:hypothetical protein
MFITRARWVWITFGLLFRPVAAENLFGWKIFLCPIVIQSVAVAVSFL